MHAKQKNTKKKNEKRKKERKKINFNQLTIISLRATYSIKTFSLEYMTINPIQFAPSSGTTSINAACKLHDKDRQKNIRKKKVFDVRKTTTNTYDLHHHIVNQVLQEHLEKLKA